MATAHEAKVEDGASISYRRWREPGASRRLALIHSLAMDGGFWTETVQALGPDWDVIAVDCRGHGGSSKPAGPYTVDLMADDLAQVLDAAGWEDAIVAGASMGGCVALAFAARHSQRTRGLGLIDTTAWYGEDAEANWEGRAQKALDGGMAALVDFQKTRWFSDRFREANPGKVDAAIEVFLANDVAAYAETCRMLGRADLRAALPALTMPVEIVVGEEDYATPVGMAEAMAKNIPGARMTVISGVRHFTPLEVPGEIVRHLRALADRA